LNFSLDERSENQTLPGVTRRQLINLLAWSCAGLVCTDAFSVALASEREPGGPVRKGQLLNESQMRLLRELVETIIPQTETPGAAATDTHGFIDILLANSRSPREAGKFVSDLDQVGEKVSQHWGKAFPDLSAQDKHAAMSALAHQQAPFDELPRNFFRRLKALTVLGYYSSEAGASEELVFLPVPGGYRGDFKLSENGGKAFSPQVF
jgi:hypothetical protein